MHPLDLLDDIQHYRGLFTSVSFWEPYVAEICQRHNLLPATPVRIGVPGTCPTFIIGERWVVKFFGRLFEGGRAFQVEREAGRLLALDPGIPAAQVTAQGKLRTDDWPWPYLVYPFLPGASLGELADHVRQADWLRIAREVGQIVKRLHALPLEGSTVFANDVSAYTQFLQVQRANCSANHRQWGTLPTHLVEQVEDFLPPLDTLVDHHRPAHLIHADLNQDHLLGRITGGQWETLGIIDFGDAMTGDLLYELGALHFGMFHADRQLLNAFLDAYQLPHEQRSGLSPAGLAQKALATALLHQFNLFSEIPEALLQAATLDELAENLWVA